MIIHRFLLIETRDVCINILSDAYSSAAADRRPQPRSRRRHARRARRRRRRDRLHRPGAAAPARAASGRRDHGGDVVGQPAPRRGRCRRWRASGTATITPLAPDTLAHDADVVFLALPDAAAAELAPALVDAGVRVIDLSGAFRLRDDARARAVVSGNAPAAGRRRLRPDRARARRRRRARGSSPTRAATRRRRCWRWRRSSTPACSSPSADIIVDAKSGVSGAGKTPTERTHFSECHGSLSAYGVFGHRHGAEIEQGVGGTVTFTPHLVPLDRGILATIYVRVAPGTTEEALGDVYRARVRRRAVRAARRRRRCPRSSTSRTRISATSAGGSTRRAARFSCR